MASSGCAAGSGTTDCSSLSTPPCSRITIAFMPRDSTQPEGTTVAGGISVARRVTALIGMAALIGLLVVLVWRVYLHHQNGVPTDEPAVVSILFRCA